MIDSSKDQSDPQAASAPIEEQPATPPVDEQPQSDRISAIRPNMSTWDTAFNQLQQRVSTLIDSIEEQSRTVALPDNVEPEPEDDRLAQATESLQADREAERAELPLLMERVKAKLEPPSNLSGILATLPEITAEQRQALSRIDHRLELMKARADATAEALTSTVREIEYLRKTVDEAVKIATSGQQTDAELAANQRQLAESLNVLHDLVGRATETVRANAAWVEMLAEAPDNRYQSLRDQVTATTARSETRSTITLAAAALAALASVIALVVALTR